MAYPKISYPAGTIYEASLLGGFADPTGQLVVPPLFIGNGASLVVPVGATQLLLGINDFAYSDNTGSFLVSVTGHSPVTVPASTRPWDAFGGLNTAYPYTASSSTSPISVSVTAGSTISVARVSGLVSLHFGVNLSDANGDPLTVVNPTCPGQYLTGAMVDLAFSYPPIHKSQSYDREAQRNDSIALSGLESTSYWRTDLFVDLEFEIVPLADMGAWGAFMDRALAGAEFRYYSDSAQPGYTVFTLEDDKWQPKFNYRGFAKFSMRLRRVVGSDQTGS